MNFLYLAMLIPIFGIGYAAFTSWLKYRQHRVMLDVLKVYAERGDTPPEEVLNALSKGFSLSEPGVNSPAYMAAPGAEPQGPARYWSLVGLFGVLAAGFGFAYAFGGFGSGSSAFGIVALCMGAVAVWSLIMAIALRNKA